MNTINIHLKIRPVSADTVVMRIGYQKPKTVQCVPFTASNGVVIDIVGSGRPFLGTIRGHLTVGIRGTQCPEAYARSVLKVKLDDAITAQKQVLAALKEFRRAVGR